MMYRPLRGILVKDETELIVGCEYGFLSRYSINDPSAPTFMSNIKLSSSVMSVLKLSEDTLLFGLSDGHINFVEIELFKKHFNIKFKMAAKSTIFARLARKASSRVLHIKDSSY